MTTRARVSGCAAATVNGGSLYFGLDFVSARLAKHAVGVVTSRRTLLTFPHASKLLRILPGPNQITGSNERFPSRLIGTEPHRAARWIGPQRHVKSGVGGGVSEALHRCCSMFLGFAMLACSPHPRLASPLAPPCLASPYFALPCLGLGRGVRARTKHPQPHHPLTRTTMGIMGMPGAKG